MQVAETQTLEPKTTPRIKEPDSPKLGVVLTEKRAKKKRTKVLRPSEIVKKERSLYPFEGKFLDSFGRPERYAKWFITGKSFSGKSSMLFELCKYLSQFGKIDYNNHEEAGGDSQTVVNKIIQSGMQDNSEVRLYKAPLISDEYETWMERLNRRQSAEFSVLDSIQHAEMDRKIYLAVTEKFCNPVRKKSLLFVSHWVHNDFTKFIKHDCDIKIEVCGFVAYVESRYGGGKPFIIWEQGAKNHWKKMYHQVIQGKYWPGKKK